MVHISRRRNCYSVTNLLGTVVARIFKEDGMWVVRDMNFRKLAAKRLLVDAENFAMIHFARTYSWSELQNAMR
jgi:hypothetical protein